MPAASRFLSLHPRNKHSARTLSERARNFGLCSSRRHLVPHTICAKNVWPRSKSVQSRFKKSWNDTSVGHSLCQLSSYSLFSTQTAIFRYTVTHHFMYILAKKSSFLPNHSRQVSYQMIKRWYLLDKKVLSSVLMYIKLTGYCKTNRIYWLVIKKNVNSDQTEIKSNQHSKSRKQCVVRFDDWEAHDQKHDSNRKLCNELHVLHDSGWVDQNWWGLVERKTTNIAKDYKCFVFLPLGSNAFKFLWFLVELALFALNF